MPCSSRAAKRWAGGVRRWAILPAIQIGVPRVFLLRKKKKRSKERPESSDLEGALENPGKGAKEKTFPQGR